MKPIHWTAEEIRFLLANYPRLRSKEIAAHLKRTPDSVRHKRHAIGDKRDVEALARQARRKPGPIYEPTQEEIARATAAIKEKRLRKMRGGNDA